MGVDMTLAKAANDSCGGGGGGGPWHRQYRYMCVGSVYVQMMWCLVRVHQATAGQSRGLGGCISWGRMVYMGGRCVMYMYLPLPRTCLRAYLHVMYSC